MKKISLFSTALAVFAGLSIAESNANATQRSNNNTNDVNEVGSLVYSNAYGQDYVNDAHSISVFKDSNGRYGIGQGTADSTAFFKINNNGTVTIWQLKSDPNTPTYKQGYTKKTVSISSLQKSENQTPAQKATINNAISAIKNNPSVTPTQSSNSTTAATNSSTTQKPTSRQELLQDQQVIDDLGMQAYNKYYSGNAFQNSHISIFKDSNGRYGIGQGTAESTMYYKINSDGKTMTVWQLASKPGTPVAQQKYTTSTISLSSLGFNPDSQTTASSNASSTQSSASQTSSSTTNSNATTNKPTTQTSSANHSAITSPKQTPAETKQVAKKASKNITVPSSQGKQTLSYYKVAALVYAKVFGADHLNDQGLQLTMNKNHSRFILGNGTADSTILFRVNQGKKTVTVWTPNNNDQSMTKTTYDISVLINEFYATDAQQNLINQTAQSLKK
ncbi:hypothetical protein H5R88_06925 [Limosilactobacillus sp. WF-MT5-A]|uniref:Lreu_0056 family protein n=1 Tax=Limosilactobacillus agrestis TaxID=2759748 RepID=UPI0015FB683B|nr:hypothetical protein [Limosilactobacillus agrestis]MBB1099837.1 hypothetical protein [Limosilactobacillus agrestis]MCD7120929.1 hypothetical protein [Limosilactobacillus agrestis]MCD7127118.1 hypothetical protein [Limosilactobacillus agrestis]